MPSGVLVAIALRDASRAPMRLMEQAVVSVERGVEGDVRGKPGPRQVTVLGSEGWQAACEAVGEALPWTLRRANLLLRGLDLVDSVGDRLRVGGALLEITEETDPCVVMDRQHDGLRSALAPDWRGGVCCRVIEGATVTVGDPVALESSRHD
jgi:MOSC domain-containing protein YiiM